jgi:hypothetical protein
MREPKVGATCKVYGEANDRFTITQIINNGKSVVLTKGKYSHGTESVEKIHSIRYPPRPKSYNETNRKV